MSDLTEDHINALQQEVTSAARTVANDWPGLIDADDAAQEIWHQILTDRIADDLIEMGPRLRMKALTTIGHRKASQYRTDYEHFSGQYMYGTSEVRDLLEEGALLDEACMDSAYIDLRFAFADLSLTHVRMLEHRYLRELPVTDTKALTRAIDALTERMNRHHRRRRAEHEGPGSRRVISNAHAQAITRNAYQPS
ncbi:hypothetical protein D5S17_09210 [Pseudonocardiaceae bacterium YIM PH 21723]|nr:hypothetical protein D5S17_09210 [Pseudonocardiaceae bacterium YIM PH 21723]